MPDNSNIIPLIPPGKIRCFITGKLRPDTPEENVRQRWARSLVDEYGYDKSDIGVEVRIVMGRARKAADLAIFKAGAKHAQENIVTIIEAKRDDKKPSAKDDGLDQLKSYMSACSCCRFGMWVGQTLVAYERSLSDGTISEVADIPRAGEDSPRRPTHQDLQPVQELTSIFKRCHNYIHANSGLQKAEAFHEMLKLIFCKTYEESEGGNELQFSIDPSERRSAAGQRRLLDDRLAPLFEQVKDQYEHIFKPDERITLRPEVVAYVVAELQYISILRSTTDVKGEAYEHLVGDNLRGDRGEYFTPRNVCDMAVNMIMALYPMTRLSSLKVVDCCCGTGGFLVSWIANLRDRMREQEVQRGTVDVQARVRERVRETCRRHLYGLDINPGLVRTAQMNLVMHGDGSTNVFEANTVKRPGEWPDQTREHVPYGQFDVVITNPPFGEEVRIDDAHILDQYELGQWESERKRSSMPAEQLFVETALNFLKPGGICALVLPDGILNNPGLAFLRRWLTQRARIVASVALPKETFGRNKGVNNPSVLIVRKFTMRELEDARERNMVDTRAELFLSMPRTAGIDKRGSTLFLRHPDGRIIEDSDGIRLIDDQIGQVASAFSQSTVALANRVS
ncbi:restriction endonuclease subunit M [Novosphingopyxis iocasae]|uniref:restriction endonuclease subunit M n=1 Tax=Novosphingopyxis iocasae TaxID=2762729 RepID=UPI001651A9F6|nr:N-6 DNA methylase [Novosphingopyxis iocasae]